MSQTLNSNQFIKMIISKKKGYNVIIENRIKLGYRTYGICNHAEFVNYMNPHDNCLWDAIIPGYTYQISDKKSYIVKNIFGYIFVPNGNHKIIIDLGLRGFNKRKFISDINTFLDEYSYLNNIQTKLFLFN